MPDARIPISDVTDGGGDGPGATGAGGDGPGGHVRTGDRFGRARAKLRSPLARSVVAACIVAALVAGLSVRAARLRAREAVSRVTISLISASPYLGPYPPAERRADRPPVAEVAVTLALRASTPVSVVDAELDGAPPWSRPPASPPSRSPSFVVRWQVLCAEVGSIPGPRLLDVDLAARSVTQHRRIRLATSDTDPVAQVFRLRASDVCSQS